VLVAYGSTTVEVGQGQAVVMAPYLLIFVYIFFQDRSFGLKKCKD
jgi:hypothetical protein